MNNVHELERLCETIESEIANVNDKLSKSGGVMTGNDATYINDLTHALKSIKTTIAMIDADDGESGTYPYYRYGSYEGGNQGGSYRGGSYNRGGSYARRRDSMGRYSSMGYSRDDNMIAELRELMQNASDDRTKQEFQRFIDKIERM